MDSRRRVGNNQVQNENICQYSFSLDLESFTMPFILTLKSDFKSLNYIRQVVIFSVAVTCFLQ